MTLHIHAPDPFGMRRLVNHCPTCKRRTRKVALLYEWYGPLVTCCACGEQWSGGEMLPRPFERGWRALRAEAARRKWNDAKDPRR